MKFKMLLFLALIMLPSIAQSNDKCLENFTHDYFDWFKGVLRSSPEGSAIETLKAEKRKLVELVELLKEANDNVCSEEHELKIKGLKARTESLYQTLDSELKKATSGEFVSMGGELRKAKSSYRAYNAKLVKQLMKETGIRW